jgi:hypothetical protein
VHREGVTMVPWRSKVLHPDPHGYRVRAERIARTLRSCV